MRTIYALLAFFVVGLLSSPAHSQSCIVDTSVYFGNGVVTTIEDASRNARITGRAVVREAPSSEGCRFEFKVAYNQSSGLLLDMLEAARQTLGNEYPTLVMAFILQKAGLPSSIFAAFLPAGTLEAFNERFRSATVQSLVSGSTSTRTLNEHVSLYTNDLQTRRVVLLAHSQGNIYANLSASRLSSQSPSLYARFAIVPVASPEYYCAKSLVGHVRFSDDLVIGAVAVARSLLGLPAPLESNDEDNYDVDFWSHYYLEAYYIDESSHRFIINGILTTARLLPAAPRIFVGEGVISGTYELSVYVYDPATQSQRETRCRWTSTQRWQNIVANLDPAALGVTVDFSGSSSGQFLYGANPQLCTGGQSSQPGFSFRNVQLTAEGVSGSNSVGTVSFDWRFVNGGLVLLGPIRRVIETGGAPIVLTGSAQLMPRQ